ncbi:MAG: hypothetical protein ACT4PI_01430, partial [Actinomycetota bacterium]
PPYAPAGRAPRVGAVALARALAAAGRVPRPAARERKKKAPAKKTTAKKTTAKKTTAKKTTKKSTKKKGT